MRKLAYIYIGDLDKKEVIKAIYDHFRKQDIDRLYNMIKDYNPGIEKNDLVQDLSADDLKKYAHETAITSINNVYINIHFTVDDELMYDELWAKDYIEIIFALKRQKGLFNRPELQDDLLALQLLDAKEGKINIELQANRDAKEEMRPLIEGENASPLEAQRIQFEELKKQKWQIEERYYGIKNRKRELMKKIMSDAHDLTVSESTTR